jgi:hypothetical protein
MTSWVALGALAGCGAQISGPPAELGDAGPSDAAIGSIDGAGALGPWSPPVKVSVASSAASEEDSTMSSDLLELFFTSDVGGTATRQLYRTTRLTPTSAWSQPVRLALHDPNGAESPRLSNNDRTLYFASPGGGNSGSLGLDIYRVVRSAPGASDWGTATALDPTINTTTLSEKWFSPCQGNRYAMAQGPVGGLPDLVQGTLGGPAPAPIAELNSPQNDTGAFLSADCLTLYFASGRTTPTRIFRAHRAAVDAAWSAPVAVDDFAAIGGNQEDPWVAADDRTFVFVSDAAGNKDVYISTR